jgi:hypothetical protein
MRSPWHSKSEYFTLASTMAEFLNLSEIRVSVVFWVMIWGSFMLPTSLRNLILPFSGYK